MLPPQIRPTQPTIAAVHIDLGKKGKVGPLALGKGLDLLGGTGLLLPKLVAGEGKDLETLAVELALQLHQLKVLGRETALRGEPTLYTFDSRHGE